jgi:hypothetical protein
MIMKKIPLIERIKSSEQINKLRENAKSTKIEKFNEAIADVKDDEIEKALDDFNIHDFWYFEYEIKEAIKKGADNSIEELIKHLEENGEDASDMMELHDYAKIIPSIYTVVKNDGLKEVGNDDGEEGSHSESAEKEHQEIIGEYPYMMDGTTDREPYAYAMKYNIQFDTGY